MKKFYIVYAALIGLVFVYAQATGWSVWDSLKSGNWGPQGQSVQGSYHK